MEKTYIYQGKEYLPRKRSFKPYRAKGIVWMNRYNEYEAQYITKLQTEINNFLMTDKKVMGKVISARNTGDAEKLNEIVVDALSCDGGTALKVKELAMKKEIAKELFVLEGENAKELCEIMFEDSSGINHEPEGEEEYKEYLKFIYEVLGDFFLKFKR